MLQFISSCCHFYVIKLCVFSPIKWPLGEYKKKTKQKQNKKNINIMCVQLNILQFTMYVFYNHLYLSDMFPDQISPNVVMVFLPCCRVRQTAGGVEQYAETDRISEGLFTPGGLKASQYCMCSEYQVLVHVQTHLKQVGDITTFLKRCKIVIRYRSRLHMWCVILIRFLCDTSFSYGSANVININYISQTS